MDPKPRDGHHHRQNDDHSNDHQIEIVRRHLKESPRIRLTRVFPGLNPDASTSQVKAKGEWNCPRPEPASVKLYDGSGFPDAGSGRGQFHSPFALTCDV